MKQDRPATAVLDAWQKEMTEGGVAERRRARRFEVNWVATVGGKSADGVVFREAASLDNLSSHGAFLFPAGNLETGMKVDLTIKLPFDSDRCMKYSAEVVRIEVRKQGRGVALRFSNIRPLFLL